MSGELGKVVVVVGGDSANFDKMIADIKTALGEGEKKAQAFGDKMKKVGADIQAVARPMMMFGAAITGGLGLAVKAFGDFDAAMNESLAIMGDVTDAQKNGMVDAAEDVARTTTFSAKEAAAAFYFLASAGLTAEQSIAALPAVSQFAQAGMMDLETATEQLSDSQSALGMRSNDAAENLQNLVRVSDVLVEAANVSNGSIEQFSSALSNSAPMMRNLNMEIEEGVAVLSVYADQGIKGEEAGMRLSIVLRDLQTRAIKNKDAFQKYNVAVYDSNGMMRNMADIVADLERALAGKTDAQKKAVLAEMEFQDRSVQSMLSLVGMSKEIVNYETKLRAAGGTTKEVADKQLQTLNNQLKLAKNNIQLAAKEIGGQLAPAVADLAGKIADVTQGYVKWAEAHPAVSKGITGVLAVLGTSALVGGTLLFALGSVAKNIGAITTLFPKLNLGFIGAASAVTVLMAEMATWLITLAKVKKALDYESEANDRLVESNIKLENKLYKLVAAGKLTLDQFYALKDQFYQGGKGADDYAQKMWNWIKSGNAGEGAAKGLAAMTAESAKQFKAAGTGAKGAAGNIEDMGDSMGDAGDKASDLKAELGLIFKSDLTKRIQQVEKALKDYKKELSPESEKALRAELVDLKVATGNVTLGLTPLIKNLISTREYHDLLIGSLADGVMTWDRLIAATGMTKREFSDLAAKFVFLAKASRLNVGNMNEDAETISNAWAEVLLQLTKDFSQAFASMATGATSFATGMQNIFSGLATSIGQALSTAVSTGLESIGAMAGPIGSLVGGVVGGMLSIFATLFEESESYAEQAQKAFADAINSIVNSLNYLGAVSGSTAELIMNSAEAIMNGWGALAESMGGQTMADAIAATLYLNELMADTGITVYNLSDYWALASTALDQYNAMQITAAQASAVLDDAFSALQAAAQDLGQEGSAAMVDFILQARAAGLEIQSVTDYINDSLGVVSGSSMSAADGLKEMAEGIAPGATDLIASLKGIADQIKDLEDEEADLKAQLADTDPQSKAAEKLRQKIAQVQAAMWALREEGQATEDQLYELGTASVDDLQRLGDQTLAVFSAMIANGASYTEALASIGPALQIISDKYKDLGLTAPASIQQLLHIQDVTDANKELFEAVAGNQAVFEMLANTGYMTADALADTAAQAGDYYNQLLTAGLTADEALATMAPTLQSIHDYAEENGIVLDENTQSLIDQAEAAGLVEDAEMSTADAMLAVGAVIAKAFGQDIPTAMQEALDRMNGVGGAVEDTADAVTDDLGGALIGITDGEVVDLDKAMKDVADTVTDDLGAALIGITDGPASDLVDKAIEVRDGFVHAADDAEGAWVGAAQAAIAEWDGLDIGGGGGDGGGGIATYASGGIAWAPQLATVAESGPEVIIPMSDYVSGTGLAANVGGGAGASMGAGTTVYLTINAQTLDDRTINQAAEKIKSALDWQARRSGRG